LDRFEFDNHTIVHNQVNAISAIQMAALVLNRQLNLAAKRKLPQSELMTHAGFIGRFEQTRPEFPMHRNGGPDDLAGKVRFNQLNPSCRSLHLADHNFIAFLGISSKKILTPCPPCLRGELLSLDTQWLATLMATENELENHARDEDRGEQVCRQTEAEGHSKSFHWAGPEHEQDDGGDDRRHVRIDNGCPGVSKALVHRR